MEVGGGQVRDVAQSAERVVGAHVEGEVGAEQHPVGAGHPDQFTQDVRVVDEGVEVQPLEVAAGRVRAAAGVGAGEPGVVGAADVGGQIAASVGGDDAQPRVSVLARQAWSERPMWVGR